MFLELRPQVLKDTENRKNNILSECHTPSRMSEDDQRWASCHTLAIPRVFVAFGSVSRDNTIIIPAVNPASSYFSSHVWWATGLIFDVFSFQRLLKIEGKWQPPIQAIAEDGRDLPRLNRSVSKLYVAKRNYVKHVSIMQHLLGACPSSPKPLSCRSSSKPTCSLRETPRLDQYGADVISKRQWTLMNFPSVSLFYYHHISVLFTHGPLGMKNTIKFWSRLCGRYWKHGKCSSRYSRHEKNMGKLR